MSDFVVVESEQLVAFRALIGGLRGQSYSDASSGLTGGLR